MRGCKTNHCKTQHLAQFKFLKSLNEDFSLHRRMYLAVWQTLQDYKEAPQEMDESEWNIVVDALSDCHDSVRFLLQISQLVKRGVINLGLLYLLYFENICEFWSPALGYLVKWCGTGLDLAANYDSYEAAYTIREIRELVIKLSHIHDDHYGRGMVLVQVERFDERVKDFLSDPSKFDVTSDNYIHNYVTF